MDGRVNHLTDAEVLAIREAAFEEARKYCEGLEKENARLKQALRWIANPDDLADPGFIAREALNG